MCADCADQSCLSCECVSRTPRHMTTWLLSSSNPPRLRRLQPLITLSLPASPSPQQTGKPASDPAARRQRTRPQASRLRDRRRRQRLAQRPVPRRGLPDPRPASRPEPPPRTRTRPGSRTMTLTIHDTAMTSDQTAHTARHAPSRNGWEVSWLTRPDPRTATPPSPR